MPPDLATILPTVYKKSIVVFRSLCAYSKLLPAWKYSKRHSKVRPNPVLSLKYRVIQGPREQLRSTRDPLTVPLHPGDDPVVDTYSFGVTESPAGPFSVLVTYRTNCEFRVDDSEALLSSRFMGVDEHFFKPSLPSENHFPAAQQEPGSLPVRHRNMNRPDLGQAYGSMSTFHQVGPTTGASPISALRAARELADNSPSSPTRPSNSPRPSQVSRIAALSGEGNHPARRRPSISIQPFKAPPLSASPALIDSPIGSQARSIGSRAGSMDISPGGANMPPPSAPMSLRKPAQLSESAVASSTSGSPRPAPISKYSSSFSHRRARLSSGGASKTDDDNNSSGRVSVSSSTVQPSVGTPMDPSVGSSGSLHADEDNISDFLKMLESRKDLLSKKDARAIEKVPKRTSAALSRFHKMKDSNAMLSESMSSSLLLQQSAVSSSKQLPSLTNPMGGASISISSSPGKAISPHTPHVPAVPSRLSSNSVVDYSHLDRNERHISSEPSEFPSQQTPRDAFRQKTARTPANAIDIPTSPRQYISSFRRSSSAAQNRDGVNVEEDLGDYLPFGMRSISLGAEERSPPSLSELAPRQEVEPTPSEPTDSQRQRETEPSTANDSPSGTSFTRRYQPRFAQASGRGSFQSLQPHTPGASNNGRDSALPDTERETSTSNNAASAASDARRGSGNRFSFNRHLGGALANTDDDEPLLFTMSDFGASRRSLEEARRGGSANSHTETQQQPHERPPSADGRGSGRSTGPSCGFRAWP